MADLQVRMLNQNLATKDDLRDLRNQMIIAMGAMLAGYSTLVFAILSYANR